MALSITALSIMTLSIMALSIMALSIMALSIVTLSIKTLIARQPSITLFHFYTIVVNFTMLSVVMLGDVMLIVVAPFIVGVRQFFLFSNLD
jgi:hypothetical protein